MEARLNDWLFFHDWDSRKNAPGFPDLVLVKPPRIIFAELKRQRGRVRPMQTVWLDALGGCAGVETYLWRPSDLDEIRRRLAT